MEERVRLINQTQYDIGVTLINGLERNIRANSFLLLPRDDVEYVYSIAPSLFDNSQLLIQNVEMNVTLGISEKPETLVVDKDSIKKVLSGNIKALRAWLDAKQPQFVLEYVVGIAKELDLPASKMKLLNEVLPGRFDSED